MREVPPLQQEVTAALKRVYDPCSVGTGTPLDIFEMGLVRDVVVNAHGDVRVTVCATTPSCVLIASIMQGAEDQVRAVPGVRSVEVKLDVGVFWTEADMTDDGLDKLRQSRAARLRHRAAPTPWAKRREDAHVGA